MVDEPFRLGTRGSALARRQAELVREGLERHRIDVEIVEVTTAGDRLSDDRIQQLGRTGAFVRDLDDRVLDGELDAAVHSLKDMPTEMPADLIVAAIPERTTPNDVMVTPTGVDVDELPQEARVGTSSLRRRAQLLQERPDLDIVAMRGNVDTRIEKLLGPHLRSERDEIEDTDEREAWIAERTTLEQSALERDVDAPVEAIVLAAAGLERMGLAREISHVRLPLDGHVPAPGQGAIAVTMRDQDPAREVHRQLDHPPSRVAATVERVVLAELGGGCIAPIGIHAVVQGEIVHTRVQVLSSGGEETIATNRDLPVEQHVEAATELAQELADQGAAEMIAEATDPE